MNKIFSKVMSALVFAILGFLLMNRFVDYWKHQTVAVDTKSRNQLSIISEIDQLKKEKETANNENSDILAKIKGYEEDISSSSQYAANLKEELERNKKLIGMTDVKGPGITIYITPKSKLFNNLTPLDDIDIMYLINELFSASAEAISINDTRITSQSAIEVAENQRVRINDTLIPVTDLITIKAIGNVDTMVHDLTNYNTLDIEHLKNYTVSIKKADEIFIPRYSLPFNTDGLTGTGKSN